MPKCSFRLRSVFALLTRCFLFAVLLLCLAACGAQRPAEGQRPAETDMPSAAPEIRALTGPDGFAVEYVTATEQGAYSLIRKDQLASNITYIDYTTDQRIYLCNRPNCSHDDASCTSWIKDNGSAQLITDGRWLYCFCTGGAEAPKLYRMGLDGADRILLYTFESGETPVSGIASDQEYLYFEKAVVDAATAEQSTLLCRLNTQTGKMETLTAYSGSAFLFGAKGRSLLIRSLDAEKTYTFAWYNLDAGSSTVLRTCAVGSEVGLCDTDDYVCFDYTDNSIKAYALDSGEMRILQSNIPFPTGALIQLHGLVDHHFLYSVMTPQADSIFMNTTTFALDTVSGAQSPFPFLLDNLGEKHDPITIVAVTPDSYLVRSAVKNYSIDMRLADGTIVRDLYPQVVFSRIKKEDLWAGREVYQPIIDRCFADG